MNSVKVTYELPAELVAEAEELGMNVAVETKVVVEAWRERIRKRRAMREMQAFMNDLQSLPDAEKPMPDEIQAEINAYWAEKKNEHP